jgi:hypothetical protein
MTPRLLACLRACVAVCARAQGIVPGGGAALLHLSELVPPFRDTLSDAEERLGAEIVMKALRAPARIIAENAGAAAHVGFPGEGGGGAAIVRLAWWRLQWHVRGACAHSPLLLLLALRTPARAGTEGEVIIQKVLGKPFTVGYNAMTDSVCDLLDEGVIDPAKVTRNGLMNACSIAGIMLTTQVRARALRGWGRGVLHLPRVCLCRAPGQGMLGVLALVGLCASLAVRHFPCQCLPCCACAGRDGGEEQATGAGWHGRSRHAVGHDHLTSSRQCGVLSVCVQRPRLIIVYALSAHRVLGSGSAWHNQEP